MDASNPKTGSQECSADGLPLLLLYLAVTYLFPGELFPALIPYRITLWVGVLGLLASVLTRELVRAQRLVSLRIVGDDRPGLLATVSATIGALGANILEVAHNRLALDVPAKGAEFDLMVETRDAQHTQEIMDALRAAGYPPRAV